MSLILNFYLKTSFVSKCNRDIKKLSQCCFDVFEVFLIIKVLLVKIQIII